jgi:hypothetical protein
LSDNKLLCGSCGDPIATRYDMKIQYMKTQYNTIHTFSEHWHLQSLLLLRHAASLAPPFARAARRTEIDPSDCSSSYQSVLPYRPNPDQRQIPRVSRAYSATAPCAVEFPSGIVESHPRLAPKQVEGHQHRCPVYSFGCHFPLPPISNHARHQPTILCRKNRLFESKNVSVSLTVCCLTARK